MMTSVLLKLVSAFHEVFAVGPGSGVGHSSGAGSPFTTYTAGVLIYGLATGVLVSILLIGAFLILNLGLLSKREEDRIGKRTPSEVGILKNNIWPEEPYVKTVLPAEEEDFEENLQKDKSPQPNEQEKKTSPDRAA